MVRFITECFVSVFIFVVLMFRENVPFSLINVSGLKTVMEACKANTKAVNAPLNTPDTVVFCRSDIEFTSWCILCKNSPSECILPSLKSFSGYTLFSHICYYPGLTGLRGQRRDGDLYIIYCPSK